MRTYLQINGQWVEMVADASQEVQLNFTIDSLENPTAYSSENSYSLKLPRCADNDAAFSHFCQLDSVILANGYDPTQRMPYILLSELGELVSTGWAYVSSITSREYTLSLTGSQSKIFSQLLNAGYDTTQASEDDDYYLMTDWLKRSKDGATFTEAHNLLNSPLVYASWLIDNPIFDFSILKSHPNLRFAYLGRQQNTTLTETNAFIASLIGFAPTAQGKYKDFDNETWLDAGKVHDTDVHQALSFLPVFRRHRDIKGEVIEAFEIEGGVIEPQIGEYRSYYQQPYIYISALWQLFRDEFENITDGYTLNLDERWFTPDNDELARLIYMLPSQYQPSEQVGIPQQLPDMSAVATLPTGSYSQLWIQGTVFVNGLVNASRKYLTSEAITLEAGESVTFSYNLAITMALQGADAGNTIYFNNNNPLSVKVAVIGNNIGVGLQSKRYFIEMLPDNDVYDIDFFAENQFAPTIMSNRIKGGSEMVQPKYTPFNGAAAVEFEMLTVGDTIAVTASEDTTVRLQFYFEFASTQGQTPFGCQSNLMRQWYMFNQAPTITYSATNIIATKSKGRRSDAAVSLETLFGVIKPFSVLLQYSKAHHLLWQVDDTERVVNVKRAADAYADMTANGIVDISDKVDKSKDITITPLSWTNKEVLMNLEDVSADYIDGYSNRAGIPYGSKRIITQNNKDKGTLKLLGTNAYDKINTSVMLSQTVAPASSLMAASQKQFFVETEPLPLNVQSEETANVYGNFYYRHNNATWDVKELEGWRAGGVYITDDLADEVAFDRFCWHGIDALGWSTLNGRRVYTNSRPVINTVSDNGLSVHFAPVREQYTYKPDTPAQYLYEYSWQRYIEEVYNPQNKVVELYLVLNTTTLKQVRNNPVVQIGNKIYLLCDIKGWSERGKICKCRLRQIDDLNKLTF